MPEQFNAGTLQMHFNEIAQNRFKDDLQHLCEFLEKHPIGKRLYVTSLNTHLRDHPAALLSLSARQNIIAEYESEETQAFIKHVQDNIEFREQQSAPVNECPEEPMPDTALTGSGGYDPNVVFGFGQIPQHLEDLQKRMELLQNQINELQRRVSKQHTLIDRLTTLIEKCGR